MDNIEKAEFTGEAQHIWCRNCFESLLFFMKDAGGEFTLGLETLIRCMEFAEDCGLLPRLPSQWWLSVRRHFGDLA